MRVPLDRLLAEDEPIRDLTVGQPCDDELESLLEVGDRGVVLLHAQLQPAEPVVRLQPSACIFSPRSLLAAASRQAFSASMLIADQSPAK